MKRNNVKKLFTTVLTACLTLGMLSGCGNNLSANASSSTNTPAQEETSTEAASSSNDTQSQGNGTIMWLSNLSSGAQYDATNAYADYICQELGYDFTIVYGDAYNDPAGNLKAVKDAMTSDIVAVIASQDGGIANIIDEYPKLYVAGYNTDMASVFGADGTSASALSNPHFLGTIADGFVHGKDDGAQYAEFVIEQGYKKVSTMTFPTYAYPEAGKADASFRETIEAYNATASEPIEIVGDAHILEFAPLDESYFLEAGNSDLNCIVAMCAGTDFVYPTLLSAIGNGSCSLDTRLVTAGYSNDSSIISDMGENAVISYTHLSAPQNIAYAICLIDTALSGKMYSDYTQAEAIDGKLYEIDSEEDVKNVVEKSIIGTTNPTDSPVSIDDLKALLPRYNSDAAYDDLKTFFASDKFTVDYYLN